MMSRIAAAIGNPKGLLVYATGKTEEVRDPAGKCMVRYCECCGSRLLFESAGDTYATDDGTVDPFSQEGQKLETLFRDTRPLPPLNRGCIVYIQKSVKR